MSKKKKISIITPVLNEENTIESYYTQVLRVINRLSDRYDFEIIFTDNCSTDRTWELVSEIAKRDGRVRGFRFSRNFGHQKSIWTGYCLAVGDAAIEIDCDLQDPPEMIEDFIKEWESGVKIVYGIRAKREEPFVINFMRKAFYRLLDRICEYQLPHDAGDFMLIDRCVLDELKKLYDHNLYLRGIIFGFGFSRKGIVYARKKREFGKSKFPLLKLLGLAIDGIVSQSIVPLRLASYVGMVIAVVTVFLSGFYIVVKLVSPHAPPTGFTTTAGLILFSITLNAVFLGIIGEYIARIYVQVKKLPITIIERRIDFNDQALEGSLTSDKFESRVSSVQLQNHL